MLALDAHPAAKQIARTATVQEVVGTQTVQAEDGTLGRWRERRAARPAVDAVSRSTPAPATRRCRTAAPPPSTSASHPRSLLMPVVDLRHGSSAVTRFTRRRHDARPGALRRGRRAGRFARSRCAAAAHARHACCPASARPRHRDHDADGGDVARLDALMVQPLVSRMVLGGDGHGTALLRSAARRPCSTTVAVPGTGPPTSGPTTDAAGCSRTPRAARPTYPSASPPEASPWSAAEPDLDQRPTKRAIHMSHPHAEFPLGPFRPHDANPILRPQGDGWESAERLQPGRRGEGRPGRAALPRARRRHRLPRRARDQRRRHPLRAAPGAGALAERALRGVRLRGPAGHRGRRHLLPHLHGLGPDERPAVPGDLDRPVHLGEARAAVPRLQHLRAERRRRADAVEQGRRDPGHARSTAAT